MLQYLVVSSRSSKFVVAVLELATTLSIVFALGITPRQSNASDINVPPVTITKLDHGHGGYPLNYIFDTIGIPGSGYTSIGFTATISTGDVIKIRHQAPPGKKFVVHTPEGLGTQYFFFDTYWISDGGTMAPGVPQDIKFEDFLGTMPTEYYSFIGIGEQAKFFKAKKDYTVTGPFEFTAIQITITVSVPIDPVTRTYSEVQSESAPSWGSSAITPGQDAVLMEIVDIGATATRSTSWGRLKSLYH